MKRCFSAWLALAGLICWHLSIDLAFADIVMTGRSSQTNYNYVYGFAASNVGGNSIFDGVLEASDTVADSYTGSASGFYPPTGVFWSAGASIAVGHGFSINPFPSGVSSIIANGSTVSSCNTSGVGSGALMDSINPGNNLTLYFSVTDTRSFSMDGSVQSTKPNPDGAIRVVIQRWDGIVWQYGGFDSLSLPNSLGSFDVTGTLTPGEYRIIGTSAMNVLGNDSGSSSFGYNFTSIPEPAVALLLPGFLATMAIQRRRAG